MTDKKKIDERYEKGKSFEQKTGELFKLMGFEVELNKEIASYQLDVFMKKKKSIGKKYEFYICECKDWTQNVGQDVVTKAFAVREAVKKNLIEQHLGNDCEAIIVARTGFAKEAKLAAEANGIILYTYDELLAELMDFDKYLTTVINDFESPPPDKPKLKDLYIEQDFFPEKENEEINSFEFVQKWLTKPDRKQFSLLGDYGTGKTSFARKLAYNMAKQYKEKPGIPFLRM
jgi:flagellar biosynthesis GTPase FlhF